MVALVSKADSYIFEFCALSILCNAAKSIPIKIVLGGNFSVWPPISLLVAFSIYFPSLSFSLRERGGRGDEREFREEREKVLLQKPCPFFWAN